MKIIKTSNQMPITASTSISTTYYQCSLSDIIDALDDADANIYLRQAIESDGFDAIDLDNNLFGSAIINDNLYICETDGKDIHVNNEDIDPEDALAEVDVEDLKNYIKESTPEIIQKYITEYEVKITNWEDLTRELLDKGTKMTEIFKGLEEFEEFATL